MLSLAITAVLAGCSPGETPSGPGDDCGLRGTMGLVDCSDPACAKLPACQPACGDGVVDAGEECDDGNRIDGDGCEANCRLPFCGNAIVDAGEECDDGNRIDGDGCEADCTLPFCGDGVVDAGEECDDGNRIDGDGCEANCRLPFCGNAIVDPGETCDDGNRIDGDDCEADCTLPVCGNGIRDQRETCDDGNIGNGDGCDSSCTASTIAYVKAFNTRFNAMFGMAVALSADGSTLVVGAIGDSSAATGIDGDQNDDSAALAGAIYVYARSGLMWERQAYIKASNTHTDAQFGTSIALSADGATLAVGAIGESSAATGVDGDQTDRSATRSGAVYLFTRTGTTWHQEAYLKASNTGGGDQFGASVALSADGSMLAVGAIGEASASIGIDGDQSNDAAPASGAVYVFARSNAGWSQHAYVKASNTGRGDSFGTSVALSVGGTTLVVGAATESSGATGIGGDQSSNAALASGAVYVFARSDATWSQQVYVKASNTGRADNFGAALALSADGATMVVGAPGEDSAATGIDGNQSSNAMLESGAAYVFTRAGTTWRQRVYVKASNTGWTDQFGFSVAVSPDGATLAVGAVNEESNATGIGGDQADNSALASGAIYRFAGSDSTWRQQAYLKASNTGAADQLGWSLGQAADGSIAVGAIGESSAATGVGGEQRDNSMSGAGAVYLFR